MDFRPPPAVNAALAAAVAHGVHGYFGDDRAYKAAITGWMARRHGWEVDPAAIATTHGVVAGLALCLQAFTEPGDGVILFTPVYHAFFRVIRANGRRDRRVAARAARGRPLRDGPRRARRRADRARAHGRALLAAQSRRPGLEPRRAARARRLLRRATTCCSSPTRSTTTSSARRHATCRCRSRRPRSLDRLVMLTATTKTFNIAGALTGNVIIPDPALRRRFAAAHLAAGTAPNRFGVLMATAAYAGGDAWVDALAPLSRRQRRALRRRASPRSRRCGRCRSRRPTSPGSTSPAPAWRPAEFTARVERDARIAPSHGDHLRRRRRELPALQHRHPARPGRRGGARGCRRPSPTCSERARCCPRAVDALRHARPTPREPRATVVGGPHELHHPAEPPARPNRCQLFGPGSRPELFAKMAASAADVINLDLEDSVSPADKPAARANIIRAIDEIDWGTQDAVGADQRPRHRVLVPRRRRHPRAGRRAASTCS